MLQNKPHWGKSQRYGFVKLSPAFYGAQPGGACCFGKPGAAAGRLLKKLPMLPTPEPTPFFGVCFTVAFSGHLSLP